MAEFFDRHPALWNTIRVTVVFALVIVVCNAFHLFGVGIFSFQIDEETQSLIFYYESDVYIDIPKDEIQYMELSDDFDRGEPVDQDWDDTYIIGKFKNDTLGEYTLYVRDNVDRVLIIKANDQYYAINYTNDDSTSELYDALSRWIEET